MPERGATPQGGYGEGLPREAMELRAAAATRLAAPMRLDLR